MKATHDAIGPVVELAVLTVGGRSDIHHLEIILKK